MSKFDKVRKNVKRKTNKLHFLYVFLFLIFINSSVYLYFFMKNNYENKIETVIEEYGEKSTTIGETLLTTIEKNKKYEHYFNSLPFGNPLDTIIVNSEYGWRKHPVDSNRIFHTGIDLQAKMNTPVYATGDGVVIYSKWKSGYGKTVIIQHQLNHMTLYSHLNKILVNNTEKVNKGDIIAYSGRTGKVSGPHLHYEIQINNKHIDPFEYLKLNAYDFN